MSVHHQRVLPSRKSSGPFGFFTWLRCLPKMPLDRLITFCIAEVQYLNLNEIYEQRKTRPVVYLRSVNLKVGPYTTPAWNCFPGQRIQTEPALLANCAINFVIITHCTKLEAKLTSLFSSRVRRLIHQLYFSVLQVSLSSLGRWSPFVARCAVRSVISTLSG